MRIADWGLDEVKLGEGGLECVAEGLGSDGVGEPGSGLAGEQVEDAGRAGSEDQWESGGGGLQHGVGHALEGGRENKGRGLREVDFWAIHLPGEKDVAVEAESVCQRA